MKVPRVSAGLSFVGSGR